MRILVTGASGKLGSYLLRELRETDHEVAAWSGSTGGQRFGWQLQPVDVTDAQAVERAFRDCHADVVLHTAAQSSVAACLRDPAGAEQMNVAGTGRLAKLAAEHGSRLIFSSTDMVFDGTAGDYRETDPTAPVSVYGRCKAAAEGEVLSHRQHAVVRLSLLFGPSLVDKPAFFDQVLLAVRQQTAIDLFQDEWRTPLSLLDAARNLLRLADHAFHGILHLGGTERISRFEMGQRLAAHLGLPGEHLHAINLSSIPSPEPRPADLSLNCGQWRSLFPDAPTPRFEESLTAMGITPQPNNGALDSHLGH